MMYKLIHDRVMWFAVLLSAMIINLLIVYGKNDVSFVIYYEEYLDNMSTRLFFDLGTGYSDKYVSFDSTSKITEVELPEEYMLQLKGIRADFTDKIGKACIKKIVIQKNGLNIINLNPGEIAEKIESTSNLGYFLDEYLVINDYNGDGQIYFDDELVERISKIYNVQITEVIIVFLILFIVGAACHYRGKIAAMFLQLCANKDQIIIISLFVMGVMFCYKDYILGNQLFIFGNIGGDSLAQTYPGLYRIAYLLENGRELTGFDFARGYGSARNLNVLNMFDWGVLFGTENLAYLMGISHILKVFLSFALFYVYLKLLNRTNTACCIGAMSYALCGHMVMRQYWKSYSNEVVLSAFLLVALELSISKNKKGLLPIALTLYCMMMGDYNSLLVFGLVAGYTVFRCMELEFANIKCIVSVLFYNICAYVLALISSSAYLMQSLVKSFSSERIKNGASIFDIRHLFNIEDISKLRIAFIRTIAEGLEGADEVFHAVKNVNILEGPTFYCGIVVLLMIPLTISIIKKKRKVIACVVILLSLSYIIFPNIRFAINAFAEFTFKLSSFWIIILMLYYGTIGIDYLIDEPEKVKYYSVYLWSVISVLIILNLSKQKIPNMGILIMLLFSTMLVVGIVMFRNRISATHVRHLLIFISFIDIFTNTYMFSNTEISIKNEDLNIYQDKSIEFIKALEEEGFYRIECKSHKNPVCVPLVQDYYSTTDYSGGTSMNSNVHKFVETMGIPRFSPESMHYINGLSNANELYNILSVKYVTTSEDAVDNDYGLELISEVDGKKVYVNHNMLPIGFCYNSFIREDELEKLTIQEKRRAVLDSCIVGNEADFQNIINKGSDIYKFDLVGKEIQYEYDTDFRRASFDELPENVVVLLEFNMEGRENSFGTLSYGNGDGNIGTVKVGSIDSKSHQSFVFSGNRLSYITCEAGNMSEIKITMYDKSEYYKNEEKYLQERRNSEFKCNSFSANNITGTVTNEDDAILYFSIPYDKGWNIWIDGDRAELEKVNYGFCGTYLPAGNHNIVLKYQIPYANISIVISIIGVVGIVLWCVYWRKREKENTNGKNFSSGACVQ